MPFSDPLADGPVIHAAATSALAGGRDRARGLEAGAQIAEHVPVVLMCYANLIYARGPSASPPSWRERGDQRPDRPRPPARGVRGRPRPRATTHGIALVPLVAPTTPDARLDAIGRNARGFVYTVSVTGTTGERDAGGGDAARLLARVKAHSPVPVALGFGISTGAHAAAAADAGADGVIVGSRLVRAVAEAAEQGADPGLRRGFGGRGACRRPGPLAFAPHGIVLSLIAGLGALRSSSGAAGLMKSFDAFLIGMTLVLLAATAQILLRYLPGSKD